MSRIRLKRAFSLAGVVLAGIVVPILLIWLTTRSHEESEEVHHSRNETEVIVSNTIGASIRLVRSGRNLDAVVELQLGRSERVWQPPGNYFLSAALLADTIFFPIPLTGYRCGPDDGGSFIVAVRRKPTEFPPRLFADLSGYAYIPSGSFLFGDRQNPREQHYLWLTGFFVGPFEVTNREFRAFINDSTGYASDAHWTEQGIRWKHKSRSNASALLPASHTDFKRFGRDDQPVTWVTWYEANAFCKWLTTRIGDGKWLFSLPTEAEWEKCARGPDNFDYGLGMGLSDDEVPLYNWKKNPDARITVVGVADSYKHYRPNRYGMFHVSGNVVEWTQTTNVSFNRERPYADDERNHDNASGLRVARGGSWYSASIAHLYLAYRDAFQPEHSSQEIGFRIVAKRLP